MARRLLTPALAVLLWLLSLPPVAADAVTVQNLRMWRAPDHTRLVFDLSGPIEHKLFTLADPHRLVIDMERGRLADALAAAEPDNPLIGAVRTGNPEGDTLRIVVDLKAEVKPRSFVLKPAGQYGHRLVVDLYDVRAAEDGGAEDAPPAATAKRPPPAPRPAPTVVVAVDAGHGGEDPGALGRRYRTREKDVTLAIARELAQLVDRAPGMRAVLIRDGDYYVGLRQRFQKARKQRADVFVSIHADAVPGRRQARGSSVYVLSERGASSAMARHLADRENAADLIGGVSLNDKDSMLARVLLDMSHSKTIEHSLLLGEDILGHLRGVGPVHVARVQQAGFAVLKSPDIPSVLVETAFISNPAEEKKLRTPAFQRRLAQGIFKGIQQFVARRPAAPAREPVTAAAGNAPREHVVRQGETLASIAQRYKLHVEALRFFNNLPGDELRIGTRLRLPPDAGG